MDAATITAIGQLITAIGVAAVGILTVLNTIHTGRVARAAEDTASTVKEQSTTIALLEKNTNSIKDELVKVTGEKGMAQGLALGMERANAAAAATTALDAPTTS